jgi:uncharacterized iron-regulated membrane protein
MDLKPYRRSHRRRRHRRSHKIGALALAGLLLFIFIVLLMAVLWLINGTKHGPQNSIFDMPE